MKKRFVATLLVGAMAVSSVIGLAACGGGSVSMPKGEEVTKEVWEKAFTSEQLGTLKNYTANTSGSASVSINGTYKEDNKDLEISVTSKLSSYATILYDEDSESSYSESTMSSSSKVTDDGETESITSKSSTKSYTEKGEKDNEYWSAKYSKSEYKDDDSKSADESYWKADKAYFAPSNMYKSLVSGLLYQPFYTSKDDAGKLDKVGTIVSLQESFEYSGGVYSANLYSYYSVEDLEDLPIIVEYKISLSFKDGYLIGYSAKVDVTDTYEESTLGIKIDYTIKGNSTYAVTNIGSTDPSKKGTGDVAKAIEKAKENTAESLLG